MRATIQVDLDGLWTYRRYFNQEASRNGADAVYSEGLLRFLEMFSKHSIKATFFIVGEDAQNPEHLGLIRQIVDQGHEVANHTMTHPLNFSKQSREVIIDEIKRSQDVLENITKCKLTGFRAATFSINEEILKIIGDMGYRYDSSIVPSFFIPFALWVSHSLLSKNPKKIISCPLKTGFAPLSAYRLEAAAMHKCGVSNLYEVPVSVVPGMRLPMHSSYVFMFGRRLFDMGLEKLIKKENTLNYLFHGIDLVDTEKHGMRLPFFSDLQKRMSTCEYIIAEVKRRCEVMRTQDLIKTMDGAYDFCSTSGI